MRRSEVLKGRTGSFFERGIANAETKEFSSLCAEPCAGASFICTVFETPNDSAEEWAAYYKTAYLLAQDMIRGLAHLHTAYPQGAIIHRDLKPENVLLTGDQVG